MKIVVSHDKWELGFIVPMKLDGGIDRVRLQIRAMLAVWALIKTVEEAKDESHHSG